ncbi:WXG100 family type VII secretion target [Herbidospora daliensis]|uniref:WXG100 family type VII secretion target n=1 Tax=Herbidospora daliensis TaxID=295585 RepID=UPI000781F182|nr:hypothetical protein [Herbidospora daliensis]
MPVLEFPAATFVVAGDPESIRDTARSYSTFSTLTGQAASDMRRLSSDEWVGSEGDLFRSGLNELPSHFDTAHQAFGQVSTALSGFAAELESAKSRMSGLSSDAQVTFEALKAARNSRSDLQPPHQDDEADGYAASMTAYEQQKNSLNVRVNGLEADWQRHLVSATALRNEAREAAGRAANSIRAAGRTSPTADQNFLERNLEKADTWVSTRLAELKSFIADRAVMFRGIAKALKAVGAALMAVAAVAMVLAAFVPVLGWLAEFPLAGMFAVGGALYGTGDALNTTVDWAEGKITGQELLFRGGLAIGLSVVGAGVGVVALKAMEKVAPTVKKWFDDVIERTRHDERGSVSLPASTAQAIRDRINYLRYEGPKSHAVQRHLEVTDDQLKKRLGTPLYNPDGTPQLKYDFVQTKDRIDPMNPGNPGFDGVHPGKKHQCFPYATRFNDASDFVFVDKELRQKVIETGVLEQKVPLKEIFKDGWDGKFTGYYINPKNPTEYLPADFSTGKIVAVYKRDAQGDPFLYTMYPDPLGSP